MKRMKEYSEIVVVTDNPRIAALYRKASTKSGASRMDIIIRISKEIGLI